MSAGIGRAAVAFAFLAAILAADRAAIACGVSAPDGGTACSLADHEAQARPWRVGVSALRTWTTLRFTGGFRGDETRSAVLATASYQRDRRWTFQAGAGATLGGRLAMVDGNHDFAPGPTLVAGGSWRAIDRQVFLLLSTVVAFSTASTELVGVPMGSARYSALDIRAGALVGINLFRTLAAYGVARAFGGPVFWTYRGQSVTGTDTHHFQLGGGFVATLGRRVNLFGEAIPLGERAAAVGLAVAL